MPSSLKNPSGKEVALSATCESAPEAKAQKTACDSGEGDRSSSQYAIECDEEAASTVEEFCASLRVERNASPHTVRAYHVDLQDFIRWAYRRHLDPLDMSHRQLRSYLAELDQAQYSRKTINRRLSTLRAYYRWLNVTEKTHSDPASVLQGPKLARMLPHRISVDDMSAILRVHGKRDSRKKQREQSFSDYRDQALLEFLYACGARISEASGLQVHDVDFSQGQVRVFGKGSKQRIIPLHELALASMHAYFQVARPKLLKGKQSPYFFVSTRGNQMGTDAIRKMFKATLRAAGVDETLSPHDMRHTFASDLLEGGADLRSVQEMLGHASLSTTQIYTHLSPEHLIEVHHQAHPRG
ncbi:MAG: tyrosine recombinase [Raoultibacter sp.]